jgi:hypothetical protein
VAIGELVNANLFGLIMGLLLHLDSRAIQKGNLTVFNPLQSAVRYFPTSCQIKNKKKRLLRALIWTESA